MVDRYLIRTCDEIFEYLYYALFIKRNQLKVKPFENDSQPPTFVDNLVETNHTHISSYSEVSILSLGEILHFWKVVGFTI